MVDLRLLFFIRIKDLEIFFFFKFLFELQRNTLKNQSQKNIKWKEKKKKKAHYLHVLTPRPFSASTNCDSIGWVTGTLIP